MYRILTLALLLILTSCAMAPSYQKIPYEGSSEIYPAVNSVFAQRGVTFEKINIFKNQYLSNYMYFTDGLLKHRAKINVALDNGMLSTQLVSMALLSTEHAWIDNPVTLFFDQGEFANTITSDISNILNDNILFKQASNEFHSDLALNYLVMRDLTDVGIKQWIKNNMLGRDYQFDLSMSNFTENDSTDFEQEYILKLDYPTDDFYSGFSIRLYTDDDHYARMKLGEQVHTTAQLAKAGNYQYSNGRFWLALVEKNIYGRKAQINTEFKGNNNNGK